MRLWTSAEIAFILRQFILPMAMKELQRQMAQHDDDAISDIDIEQETVDGEFRGLIIMTTKLGRTYRVPFVIPPYPDQSGAGVS